MRDGSQGTEPVAVSIADCAPALELFHARQEARGFLNETDVHSVAREIGVPPAELYGAVSAYPRFRFQSGEEDLAVCGGPVCRMHGAEAIRSQLGDVQPTHCIGLCDQPVAALTRQGPRVVNLQEPGAFIAPRVLEPSVLPSESCLFGEDDPFQAMDSAVRRSQDELMEVLLESGLQGRGGAGFPAGRKWQMVHSAPGPQKVVVCNADESEPGTFKDRYLLDHQPRRVLAGMAIAAHAVGAKQGLIYLRHEYGPQYQRLADEIGRLRSEGRLSSGFDVVIRRGAGLYVCGEETALLNSLEARRPVPRDRPPYPPSAGLFGMPTLVQNVETLAAVPAIVAMGSAWFRSVGMPKLYCVSGDVANPGVFERSLGITAGEIIGRAGANLADVKAFTLGGLSGGLLPARNLDLPLDFDHPRRLDAYLGSGAVIVLDQNRCAIRFVAEAMRFFADESCGKCFPCRIGTTRLAERFESLVRFNRVPEGELQDIGAVLTTGSACGLGPAAALIVGHAMKHFRDEIEAHAHGQCLSGECQVI